MTSDETRSIEIQRWLTERRYRNISIKSEAFISLCSAADDGKYVTLPILDLPPDYYIGDCQNDLLTNSVLIRVYHGSFDEVESGSSLPILPIDFKSVVCKLEPGQLAIGPRLATGFPAGMASDPLVRRSIQINWPLIWRIVIACLPTIIDILQAILAFQSKSGPFYAMPIPDDAAYPDAVTQAMTELAENSE